MRVERARNVGRGIVRQVQPTFFVPAVGMALFGGLLADTFAPVAATVHVFAVGLAIYVAHLTDGYVDFYVRGEDDDPALSAEEFRLARYAASLGFLFTLIPLWVVGGSDVVGVTIPLWILAILHAPYLDRHPVPVTADYALGVAFALCGGYLAQTSTLPLRVASVAAAFFLFLAGVKVSVDQFDYEFDVTISKVTVPVLLGRRRAALVAASLIGASGILTGGLTASGVLPRRAAVAVLPPFFAAAAALPVADRRALHLQMVAAYLFSVALYWTLCRGGRCALPPL